MATSATALLGLALPVTGTLSGTWGDTVNNAITSLVDSAVAGTTTVSADTDVTLTTTTLAANEARQAVLLFSGARTAIRTVTAPAQSKTYVVINATTGGYAVKLVGAGPTTGLTIPSGRAQLVTWNGSDFVFVEGSVVNLNSSAVTGTLPVANGGTGATTMTGLVKGTGTTAMIPATAGTDYVAPATATLFTAKQTFAGDTTTLALKLSNALEPVTIAATAATGSINFDLTTQSVLYYTTNASGNWTLNFRASSGTTLNAAMATGESITAVFMVTQGTTAYYNAIVAVDGVVNTAKWQGGSAPATGNTSGVDVYAYTIIKTGSTLFTVLASQTQFK